VVERLEQQVRAEVPELRDVHTHFEPLSSMDWATRPATGETEAERQAIVDTVRRVTGSAPLRIGFRDGEGGRVALVTVTLPGDEPLPSAHRHAGAIEEAVRERCPELADVIVHTEPADAAVG
jgi:divalent metal cation (Fe/Co/Zn/Cd) transporter